MHHFVAASADTQFKVPAVMRVIHGKVCREVSSDGVSNHCTMEKGNMNHEVDFGGSWKLQPVGHSTNFFVTWKEP